MDYGCCSERDCVKDETIINETAKTLTYATGEHGMAIVETAGGVCSPFPSETLQVCGNTYKLYSLH